MLMCRAIQHSNNRSRAVASSLGVAIGLLACSWSEQAPVPRGEQANVIINSEVIHHPSEATLMAMTDGEQLSGAVLVKRGDTVVHARAYGNATIDTPNRLNTVFHVGSVTKQFTAAAIMQLVEQGLIALDGNINGYLPEKYRSTLWSSIRVYHLLAHTSGIPDYAITRDYYQVVDGWAFGDTVDGMIREAMGKAPEFAPGTDFNYSNIGYTLLGQIIEQQTGLPYAAYIKDNLLNPIAMADSRIHVQGHDPVIGEAVGLHWNDEQGRYAKDDALYLPVTSADGGLITTLDDFVRWIAVYRDMAHPRLSRASLQRMVQPSIPAGSYDWPEQGLRGEASYGLGIATSGDLLMHEGYIVGFRSSFIYSRNEDLLVAVFTNSTNIAPVSIAMRLFEIHGRQAVSREAQYYDATGSTSILAAQVLLNFLGFIFSAGAERSGT